MKIFLFHRVNPYIDPLWPAIQPEVFRKQITYISNKYTVVNIEDYLQKNQYRDSNKPLASIVFDDGYKDFLDYALPILEEFKITPSIYIVTNTIDEKETIWTFLFDHLFMKTGKKSLTIDLRGELKMYKWKSTIDKFRIAKELKIELKKDRESRVIIMDNLIQQFDDVEMLETPYLNWDELRYLQQKEVVIGSHTANHEMLDQIDDEDELTYELKHSGKRIMKELGVFPYTISYPNGNYNSYVIECAKKAGYQCGLSVKQKEFKPSIDDLFEIPRIELFNEPLWKTKLRINQTIPRLKRLIGR